MVDQEFIITIAAGAIFLGLAVLTAARGRRESGLALPTALLCVDLSAYLGFATLSQVSEPRVWEAFEAAAAALAGPLLFHLTLAFVGARRQGRILLLVCYGGFGLVALSSLLALAIPSWSEYPGGPRWALAMLLCTVPTFAYALSRLRRHYRECGGGEERGRTQLFFAAVSVGVGGALTDLVAIGGATGVPQLAGPGMLLSAMLLTALALRARFVSGGFVTSMVTAGLIGVVGVVSQFIVFRWLGSTTTALGLGTLLVTVAVLGAARAVWASHVEVRERTAHLATLGRLSAQMAHDIRNPLAAIRGAAQYLDEERKRGGSLADSAELLALIVEQTERLDRVVSDYRRLGDAEPAFETVEVAALLDRVLSNARLVAENEPGIVVEGLSSADAGEWSLDPELVTTALENLVRNAVEAMQDGGVVRVEAHVERALSLCVSDDGPGMDARTREQSTHAFFTTKATGSGLGLAFARRVAEAHGGRLEIESLPGRRTSITLVLARDPGRP